MDKHDIEFEGNFIEFLVESIWVDFIAGLVSYITGIVAGFLPWGPAE